MATLVQEVRGVPLHLLLYTADHCRQTSVHQAQVEEEEEEEEEAEEEGSLVERRGLECGNSGTFIHSSVPK